MIIGLFLITFGNFPILVIQLVIILFPVLLVLGAGSVMYKKNSHKFVETFAYSSAFFALAVSLEFIFLFFLLQIFNKTDDYCQLVNQFQGLGFPIAIFGLTLSIVMGIESNMTIRKELSEIKGSLKTKRYRRFS